MAKEKQSFFEKIIKPEAPKKKEAEEEINNFPISEEADEKALKNNQEGQLSVDVYETDSSIVVESIVGGVKIEDINISVSNNVLTLKGIRKKMEETDARNYFVAECFWGSFSRSIILPSEVDIDAVKATMKNGILKIVLPKASAEKVKKITIDIE